MSRCTYDIREPQLTDFYRWVDTQSLLTRLTIKSGCVWMTVWPYKTGSSLKDWWIVIRRTWYTIRDNLKRCMGL